ncbi:MAG: hypothetical protein J6W64_05735 [Bacilli bacterium]|nr:hypothetical protein [Bacilli bacterium]
MRFIDSYGDPILLTDTEGNQVDSATVSAFVCTCTPERTQTLPENYSDSEIICSFDEDEKGIFIVDEELDVVFNLIEGGKIDEDIITIPRTEFKNLQEEVSNLNTAVVALQTANF